MNKRPTEDFFMGPENLNFDDPDHNQENLDKDVNSFSDSVEMQVNLMDNFIFNSNELNQRGPSETI